MAVMTPILMRRTGGSLLYLLSGWLGVMGWTFQRAAILIIHHNTKEGKFRGTSAIKAAVDETWNMRKVSLDEIDGARFTDEHSNGFG